MSIQKSAETKNADLLFISTRDLKICHSVLLSVVASGLYYVKLYAMLPIFINVHKLVFDSHQNCNKIKPNSEVSKPISLIFNKLERQLLKEK